MYACSPDEMHERVKKKKTPFPVIIPAVLESYVPGDDEFCVRSSQVSSPSVYYVPYIYTRALFAVLAWRFVSINCVSGSVCH